jgi:ABC-type polysaccharide/polyol phosphate export permease
MPSLFYTIATGSFVVGFGFLLIAKSVLHEQLAGIAFLICAVFFCAAPIVQLLEQISEQLGEPEDE